MNATRAPRVLLGKFEPIFLIGLRRVLAEDGMDVIGHEERPQMLLSHAGRERPDAVVLDLNDEEARDVARHLRSASPQTKVILWARDETVMEVLDPGVDRARLVAVSASDGLRTELESCTTRNEHRHRVEE